METISKSHSFFSSSLFKSYYVVWKLWGSVFSESEQLCLNRTMQYGNYFCYVYYFISRDSLNRTMQYGNYIKRILKITHTQSLNRTMQYGNRTSAQDICFDLSAFKSYYVVWKRDHPRHLQWRFKEFKSYYVVWKQAKGEGIFQGDIWV